MSPYVREVVVPTDPADPGRAPSTDRVDPGSAKLQEAVAWLTAAPVGTGVPDPVRIDRIAVLEQLRHAAAALQALEIVAFARSQLAAQRAADVDPRLIGKGVADQVALACHVSPAEGSQRLATARSLSIDLPRTFALWRAGLISDRSVRKIHGELNHLDAPTRRSLDEPLVAAGLPGLSERQIEFRARALAQRADPAAVVRRVRIAESERRVTVRPAPDCMAVLTATLPVAQGVACWAALNRQADKAIGIGDGRSRGQFLADTLVERLTGQVRAGDVNFDVGLLVGVDTLLDPDCTRPALITGHGPVPAAVARELLATSGGRKAWRRLFTAPPGWTVTRPARPAGGTGDERPESGPHRIVAVDDRRRRFDGWLADLIRIRDGHCRDPYCDAPVRQIDHAEPYRNGGATDLANGRAVCARGNLVKEAPGWTTTVLHDGLGGDHRHTVRTTTPTGHRYLSRADEPP